MVAGYTARLLDVKADLGLGGLIVHLSHAPSDTGGRLQNLSTTEPDAGTIPPIDTLSFPEETMKTFLALGIVLFVVLALSAQQRREPDPRSMGGGDGLVGDPESARYIMCPLHRDPTSVSLAPGEDNIQGFPMHIEHQPPSQFEVFPDGPRGNRLEIDIAQNFFGPTPPLGTGPFAEGDLVRHFNCLQRTGDWCP